MSAALPNLRYELKFLANGHSLAEALALVRHHPASFREAFPPRTVNNLYLDSPGLRDYFDHVNGVADRAKSRIRWYGPLTGRVEKPMLERKIKRGAVSGKALHALPPLFQNGGGFRHTIGEALGQDGLAETVRSTLRQLEPSVLNRYRRHYFESADRRFRLTVDSELQFASVRGAESGPLRGSASHGSPILELKYQPQHADRAAAITNALPFRVTRCSKYVLGIETIGAV